MSFLQPIRYAWRSLRRTPVFTSAAVLTLAIGIGAAAAIFAVVDGILLRPLPYGHPEQLVGAWNDLPPLSLFHANETAAMYFTFKRFAHTISGIAVYQSRSANIADPKGVAEPERVSAGFITASLIPLLQVRPALGRSFTSAEDQPHGPPVVIISDALWRTRLGADPHVIGRTLDVSGVSSQIVGVMPATFRFPDASTELWLPLALDPNNSFPGGFSYNAIARLKPGVTIPQAERDFRAVLPRVVDVAPMMAPNVTTQMLLDQAKPRPVLTPMRDDVVGSIANTLWVVAATAALLLLVACANVANLILVRADGRQRELAVRAALGAGQRRVLMHFLMESIVVAAIAGVLGLLVAWAAIHALVTAGPAELPRLAEARVNGTVVLFTFVMSALIAIACSLFPALRFGRTELASTLREGGRNGTAGRSRQRVRGALVTAQIALALVVLAGSGLLLRSFQRLHDVRPGWNPEHLATFWMALPRARYQNDTAVVNFYAQLTDRVAALPGVRAVGLTSRLPLESHGDNTSPIWVEGDASAQTRIPPLQLFITTDGGFFKAMGIPLLAGHTFERLDGRQRGDEAIVNRVTAEKFWHDPTGRQALGKRFRTLPNGPWYTVVGVVAGVRDSSLQAPPALTVYFPEVPSPDTVFDSQLFRQMGLVVRTAGDPTAITRPVQQVVRELDPTLPTFDVRPMTDVVRGSLARLTFTMLIIGVAGVVTLLLGAIGLYGVIAYVVSLRTRELGVRIALGASPSSVARMVTRQGIALTAAGIIVGLVLFALVARFIRSLLFGVAPGDPVTLVAVAVVLLAIAALASWIPARRAARVDPMEALRAE
ncbi:MAG TPA: ABC transporter permease [Gemmatimonadaceae bacterium]|nr:ABC transporter permease [Gemmatimonadaceae bacterium]